VDGAAFAGDATTRFAHNRAVQEALAWGVALNWYLTDNLLIAGNFEITDFSGLGEKRPTEQVFITRFQVDF
jgi:phosphate-selective porin